MSFDKARFMADFERVNGGSTAQPVQTSTPKSAAFDRDQFIKDFERVNGKTQAKGQAYTAPAVVQPRVKTAEEITKQQNYEQMQKLFEKNQINDTASKNYLGYSQDKSKEKLKTLNAEISALHEVKGDTAQKNEKMKQLLEQKEQLEKQAKVGLYDEDLTMGERIDLTAKSIATNTLRSPRVIAKTTAQMLKEDNRIAQLERLANNGVLDEIGWQELAQLKEQAKENRLDISGDAFQDMIKAQQYAQKATEGFNDTQAFYYNVGASITDNLTTLPLNAVLPGSSLAVMGAKSAAGKMVETGQDGQSAAKAFGQGATSGLIEAATEKLPLDNLVKIAKGSTGKVIIKNILQQAGTEGAEETVAYVLNYIADLAFENPNAEFSFNDLVMSALGGAVSGGVMGAGAEFIGRNRNTADAAENTLKRADNIDTLDNNASRASSEEAEDKVAETPALTAENGIKNTENESYSDKNDSIIVKLKKAIPQIEGQQTVSKVTGEEFKKGNLTLVQQVGNFFKSLGNKVSRNGFGDIIIDERGVQTDIAHGIGRAKSATFAAVPDVLKNGIQIDYQQNWKGRGYDSYVFAAPIEYAGNTAYVAAAVTKGDDNRFYLHEVVDGDGNIIYTKKQTPDVFKSGVTVQDGITATSSVYNNNVPYSAENNNGNIVQPTAKTAERAALEKQVQELVGIDTRSEVEKVSAEQQQYVENMQQLVENGVAPAEHLEQAQQKAAETIREAENKQANLDYQKQDADSGAVRQQLIDSGRGDLVSNIENFTNRRGLKVKYYSADANSAGNGYIDGDTIYINVQDSDVMYKTAIHETIHGLRSNNQTEYTKLYDTIMSYAEQYKYLNDIALQTEEAYTNPDSIAFETIVTEDGSIDGNKLGEEVLCKLCEEVIKDPESFIKNVDGDINVLSTVRDLLRKIKNSLAITLTKSEKAKLDNALLAVEQYLRTEGGQSNKKYSYGGISSANAPDTFLRAERLAEFDTDNETIRQETGWFKGADGKWRFEIDDSKATVSYRGDLEQNKNPEYREYQDLFNAFYIEMEDRSDAEFERFKELDKKFTNAKKDLRLKDYMQHDELYRQYPKIAEIPVAKITGTTNGRYDGVGIQINENYLRPGYEKQLKETLLHEVQHIIQETESFAGGASTKYWTGREGNSGKTARELYLNTAGEQESRDVEKRMNYTAEQRRAEAPFTGDENTVFVEDAKYSAHISNTAEQEINKALADKNYRQEIKLRDYTPSVLVEHGARNLPMLMKATHLRENILTQQQALAMGLRVHPTINYHGLGKSLFIQVVDSLDNPQRVYRGTKNADNSSRGENYFLIISTIKDSDGNSINVPVYIEQTGNYNNVFIDTNKIATVFGRKDINEYIKREISKGNLVQVKRKSSLSIKGLSPIKSALDKTTSVNNVSQISENSNGNNLQNNGNQNSFSISSDIGSVAVPDELKGLSIRERIEARANSGVTAKSHNVQTKAENTLIKTISNAFGVKYNDKQGVIKDMVKEITAQVKATGTVKAADINSLVDAAFEKGVISANELAKQYPKLKAELRESRFKYQPNEVFQNMRNSYFGKLRFAKDGTDVDILYKEYSERYPELFPDDITNPEDQIVKIGDVYDSLAENEVSLADYYGDSSEEMKTLIREDMQYAVDRYIAQLQDVEHFESDKRISDGEKAVAKEHKQPTMAEYKAAQDAVYKAQKLVDSMTKDMLLTEDDKKMIDTLLAGGNPAAVTGPNRQNILAVYAAKKAVKDARAPIKQYQAAVRNNRNDMADSVLTTFRGWKDKKFGLGYSTETFERNIRDIVPDKAEAQRIIDTYITPIHTAEAQSNRLKKTMRDRVRALNLDSVANNRKAKLYEVEVHDKDKPYKLQADESGLVQLYGEKKITKQQLEKVGADVAKIENAVAEFRKIYEELYNQANEALLRNGYAPLGKIKDYFPHFTEENDTVLSKLAAKAGFEVQTNRIPAHLAGLTETFKPGKHWWSNMQHRTGDTTLFDAVAGFDQYIEGVANIINHTDNIQNLRTLENRLRYLASDKGIKEELDRIDTLDISETEKYNLKEKVHAEADNSNLANFVTYLRDYTNNLAGKKDFSDRQIEHDFGRGIYTVSKALEGRIASNMIGANVGSALTNFIPIAQAKATIKTKHLLNAMNDTMRAFYGKDNGFENESDFLTNRFAGDKLVYTRAQKMSNWAGALMTICDRFTSNVVTRARYLQNLENGMSDEEAMAEANSFAAGLIADRSKGAVPLVFERKNPIVKAVTMFQVEQNNQLRYLIKDLPKDLEKKGMTALVWALVQYSVASCLYNELYKIFVGRRPAFDPIDIGYGIVKDAKAVAKGEMKRSAALTNAATAVSEELPFVSGLVGGGRVPISSAMPEAAEVIKLFDSDVSAEKKKSIAKKELTKPLWYLAAPTGGGQIKKAAEAVGLYGKNDGVQYSIQSDGSRKAQFAVDKTAGNMLQSALFGKWSSKEAQAYIDNGFKGLTKKQTEAFDGLKETGMSNKDAWAAADWKAADTDGNGSLKTQEAKDYLDKIDLTREQKKILFSCMCPNVKNNPYE